MTLPHPWIVPEWAASPRVRAFVTTRAGGVSQGEHGTLNLGARSGDEPHCVAENRRIVTAHLPEAPTWADQVHGIDAARLEDLAAGETPRADALVTSVPGRVCAVLTADCMPLLLCDAPGTVVAAVHAGWRGMAAGVIENAVARMGADPGQLLAWMGPAIGPASFEVGPEVREAFCAVDADAAKAFAPGAPGKYQADLYHLARQRLARAGVGRVAGGGLCTSSDAGRFFSYRRARLSGRMGAFIWMEG